MIDSKAMQKLSYGLFVLTARQDGKDAGCIINTAQQISSSPITMSITVNKQNHTHDVIKASGEFNLSVLDESATFELFTHFGFQSGHEVDKFKDFVLPRTENGLTYLGWATNAVYSCRVISTVDCGTHTLFIAEVTEARTLSQAPSATYAYYFAHIKPKPQPKAEEKKGWVCKICGYVYEGEELPPDYICPLCKHGSEDFEKL